MANIREHSCVTEVWRSIMGGKYRVRLEEGRTEPGHRYGLVLDVDGEVIGSASDYTYGGRGFAVHTTNYAGYVPTDQIEFVED